MRFSWTILLFIVSALLSCEYNRAMAQAEAIKTAVQEELRRYPRATLLDLYKFFFQGAFGAGHLIPNPEAALQYLEEELRARAEFDTVRWQPVGHQGRYYRINLSMIKDGVIPQETLLEAFVQSANSAPTPSLEEWRREWQAILKVIESMQLNLSNFENDKVTTAENLAAGKVIGHHSETFEQLYHPHYRVVDKKHFEALMQ